MFLGVLVVVFTFARAVIATSPSGLVPSRRGFSLERRSVWRRDITPKSEVALNYALASYYPPSAAVSLTAQDGRPILLLEDFDHLLHGLSCSYDFHSSRDTIHLDFIDDFVFEAAAVEWGSRKGLAVVTSHPGCNPSDERGAWIVASIVEDPVHQRLTVVVEPTSLRALVKTFAVHYNHNGARVWVPRDVGGLERRQLQAGGQALDTSYTFGWNPTLDAMLSLWPPNRTLNANMSQSVISQITDADVDLFCADCGFHLNATLGVDLEVDIVNPNCANPLSSTGCFTINTAAMNLTMDQFELDAELGLSIAKELNQGASFKILQIPVGPGLHIPSLIDIGPDVGIELVFALNISANINFTYGAKGLIPPGTFAAVSLFNSSGDFDPSLSASGWDNVTVQQIPFRVDGGVFDITASVALAPYAEVAFTILNVGAVMRIVTNLPKLDITAALKTPVNRNCSAVGEDDFEYFEDAFSVTSGLELSAVAEWMVEEGVFTSQGIPPSWEGTLFDKDIPLLPAHAANDTSCYVLADGNTTNAAAASASGSAQGLNATLTGAPQSTGTLFPAATAIPTWNFSKIESYSSANGHLPTNVNYGQMVQATVIPTDLQGAVTQAATSQASQAAASQTASGGSGSGGGGGGSSSALRLTGLNQWYLGLLLPIMLM